MRNQVDTLTLAIQKALANGWKPELEKGSDADQKRYVLKHAEKMEYIIYNHDFAKALWGEKVNTAIDTNAKKWSFNDLKRGQPNWKYHLQEMVIAPDPLEYLASVITTAYTDSSQTEGGKNVKE